MDRTTLITARAYDVRIIANGVDITDKSPVASVKYDADGTGSRMLRNGSRVAGTWRFTNPEQTKIEVHGPEGTSRWIIVELSDRLYRKVNVDTGIEFIHVPKAQ